MGFSAVDKVFSGINSKIRVIWHGLYGAHFTALINKNYRDSYRFFCALKPFSSIIMKKMSGYLWTGWRNATILTEQLCQTQRGFTG
jgi:hypothetical protein